MAEIAPNWFLHVDVGPEWLFFRLSKSPSDADPAPPVAARIWEIAEARQISQLVFELEAQTMLTSHLIGQLVLLHKRCHLVGGVLRICGFDSAAYDVLRIMRLDERFPNYRSRQDAVMGHRPGK